MDTVKVLMVDDDRDIGTLMKLKLSREAPHFTFTYVESGRECLDSTQCSDVDCILSDYQMPGMDGMELLQNLRAVGKDIPFIFLTGQGNEEVAREAFKNGAYDYFTKEIGFAHFARIINSIEQAVKGRAVEMERKRADEALKASEQRLALHVQQTPLGAIEWDVDFRVVSWNPAAEKMFGYKAEEAIGRISMFIIPEDVRPHVDDVWNDLLTQKGGTRSTNENLTKDGRTILCEWYNTPLVAPDGGVIGVASFVQDVTERREAERALLESEEKFRKLVEKSLVGVYLIQDEDSGYVFKYVNSTMAGIFGYTADQMTGMRVEDALHPEDVSLVNENLRRRIAGEIESINYSFRGRKEGGEIIDVMVYGTRTTFMEKPAVIGTLLDITERKKAMDALIESEEKFRHLVEQAADAVFLHDSEGRIVDVNQQACDSLGYTREELLGMMVQEIEAAFESVDVAGRWNEIKPDRPVTIDGIHRRKDGTTFPVEVRVGTLNVGGKQLMLALTRDITERKKAEERITEQREFLRKTIESLTHPFYVIDAANYEIVMANTASGYDTSSDHKTCYEITHKRGEPCGDDGHACPLDLVKETKGPVVVNHTHYDDEGNERTIEVHGYPILDENGDVVQMIEYALDITERVKVEDALRASQKFLETIIETEPECVKLIAPDGTLQLMNRAGLDMIQADSLDQVKGKPVYGLIAPEYIDAFKAVGEKVLRGEAAHLEFEMIGFGGRRLRLETHAVPLRNEKDEIIALLGVTRDVTERREADRALRQSEWRLKAILDNIPDIAWLKDHDGKYIAVNAAFSDACGMSPLDISSRTDTDIWPDELSRKYMADDAEVIKSGKRIRVEENMVDKDGNTRRVETIKSPFYDDEGKVIGTVGIARFISGR